MASIDPNDGGWTSRKMVLTYAVTFLGTVGFAATGKWPALATAYSQYCMFLLAAVAVYTGGNAVVKAIASKQQNAQSNANEGQ